MGCGVSTNVPCATVKTVPYERLKRPVDDISDFDEHVTVGFVPLSHFVLTY